MKQAAHYLDIEPNAIERHSIDLYDRGIQKRLGDLEGEREPALD